jgi:hypothetical protein
VSLLDWLHFLPLGAKLTASAGLPAGKYGAGHGSGSNRMDTVAQDREKRDRGDHEQESYHEIARPSGII